MLEKKNLVNYFSYKNKYIYVFSFPIVSSIFLYLNYQSSFNIELATRSAFDIFYEFERLLNISIILPSLIEAIFFKNIIIQGDLNNYSYLFNTHNKNVSWLFSAFSFLVLMNMFLILLKTAENKVSILLYVLNIGFMIYFVFLISIFVFGMSLHESQSLSSYERYISPYIFGFMLFLSILISKDLNLVDFKIKSEYIVNIINYRKILFISILVIIYIFNGLYCTRLFVSMNPDVDFVNKEKNSIIHIKDFVEELDQDNEHKNVAVIFKTNIANIKWIIFKYMMAPHHDVYEIKYNEHEEEVKESYFLQIFLSMITLTAVK